MASAVAGFGLFTGVTYLYLPCVLRILILLAVTLSCSFAQTITVTLTGTVEGLEGSGSPPFPVFDSSVQIGTPFTFVQTIDATAQLDPVVGDYPSGNAFLSSLRVGDYDFVSSGNKTFIIGDGFEIALFPSSISGQYEGLENPTFGAEVFPNSNVSNNYTLSSLLQDDFYGIRGGSVFLNEGDLGLSGNMLEGFITSYIAIETPEPSTWVLLLFGLGFAGVMAWRVRA